jgi:hypothetical protein
MAPTQNAFALLRSQIDDIADALQGTQSATVLNAQAIDSCPQVLLCSNTAAQGDSILWLHASLSTQDSASAHALLAMHCHIHRAAQDLRI